MTDTTWDNVYFDGLIKSRNAEIDGHKATEGVMQAGEIPHEFEANAGREHIAIVSGELHYRARGEDAWQTYAAGTSFVIPTGTHFLWRVEVGEMHYTCTYLDKPVA